MQQLIKSKLRKKIQRPSLYIGTPVVEILVHGRMMNSNIKFCVVVCRVRTSSVTMLHSTPLQSVIILYRSIRVCLYTVLHQQFAATALSDLSKQ